MLAEKHFCTPRCSKHWKVCIVYEACEALFLSLSPSFSQPRNAATLGLATFWWRCFDRHLIVAAWNQPSLTPHTEPNSIFAALWINFRRLMSRRCVGAHYAANSFRPSGDAGLPTCIGRCCLVWSFLGLIGMEFPSKFLGMYNLYKVVLVSMLPAWCWPH